VGKHWWQSRTWLLAVVFGFPFLIGLVGAGASFLFNSGPTPSGCGQHDGQYLKDQATALSADIGLKLGEAAGCDSGDGAWIDWSSDQTPDQVAAAAHGAGCHDGPVEDDSGELLLVCGSGPQRIGIFVMPPVAGQTTEGSIQFGP